MTEEQAKQRWCPMVRVSNDSNDAAENRAINGGYIDSSGPGEGTRWNCCIGSACMMWRLRDDNDGWCGLAAEEGAI